MKGIYYLAITPEEINKYLKIGIVFVILAPILINLMLYLKRRFFYKEEEIPEFLEEAEAVRVPEYTGRPVEKVQDDSMAVRKEITDGKIMVPPAEMKNDTQVETIDDIGTTDILYRDDEEMPYASEEDDFLVDSDMSPEGLPREESSETVEIAESEESVAKGIEEKERFQERNQS